MKGEEEEKKEGKGAWKEGTEQTGVMGDAYVSRHFSLIEASRSHETKNGGEGGEEEGKGK